MSPGLAKNTISVAACSDGHSGGKISMVSSYSSIGPTLDGRLKPDITTPGDNVMSAAAKGETNDSPTCSVAPKSGTSMAAPVAAGNIALIQQYFQDSHFWKQYCNPAYPSCSSTNFQLSGSLLKALVLHSGQEMTMHNGINEIGKVPDIFQGHGRMSLLSILPLTKYDAASSPWNIFVDTFDLPQSMELVYQVNVVSKSSPLKVSICWYDPPSQVFASKFLLNDIDLLVQDPSGNTFYGNIGVLDYDVNKVPPLGSRRDTMNPNEQVFIKHPQVGQWTIRIQGKSFLHGISQKVSVVVTAEGNVGGSGLEHNMQALSGDLSYCVNRPNGNVNKNEVDVSLWSLVWKAIDTDKGYYE